MMDCFEMHKLKYLTNWFETARLNQKGFSVYTATELFNVINANYTDVFPLTQTKLGRDLRKLPFVIKRKEKTCYRYAINWDYDITK